MQYDKLCVQCSILPITCPTLQAPLLSIEEQKSASCHINMLLQSPVSLKKIDFASTLSILAGFSNVIHSFTHRVDCDVEETLALSEMALKLSRWLLYQVE